MVRTAAFVTTLFLAVTILFTYPLSTRAGREALDLGPDTRLFLWTLAWDAHALAEGPRSIFDANIFYPERKTLAFSEHQIGSALIAAPVLWTTGNVLLGMNCVLLLSTVLSGVFTFYLARQLGLSRSASVFAGLVFLLTPPRLFRLGQLHLATVQWIPLCLALLHRYAQGGTRRYLLLAVLAFTLQALSGGQSALFLAFAGTGLVLYLALFGSLRPRSPILVDFALAGTLAGVLNLPFLLPYVQVRQELGLERSLDEAREWSPNAESFVASPAHLHRALLHAAGAESALRDAKAFLFPGIVPLLLSLVALHPVRKRSAPAPRATRAAPASLVFLDAAILALFIAAILIEAAGSVRFGFGGLRISAGGGGRAALGGLALIALRFASFRARPFGLAPLFLRLRDGTRDFLARRFTIAGGFYLTLFLLALWVSLGPGAGLYAALYRLVPGFDFIRVPSRFTLLGALALAVLSGFGLERIGRRWTRALLMILTLVELAAFPLATTSYSVDVSPMDRFLAGSPPAPAAVFPIPDPRDTVAAASRHSLYMLYSTAHFLPLVNGYSGFTPESHDRLFRILTRFPDDEGLSELERLRVVYAVFHRSGYDSPAWENLLQRIEARPERLSLVASFDEGAVYRLSRSLGFSPDR